MKIISIDQNTNEWLHWRDQGIGASEASCVLQESPYMTRRELWLSKKGKLKKDDGNEYIFSRGHQAEEKMRSEILELTGETFKPLCIQHPDHDFMIASLDGYSDRLGVLEAKLVGKDVLKTAIDKGEIPRHHWIQMQHQMIVAGVDRGQYFCSDLKNNGVIVEVKLNHEFCQDLMGEEYHFWESVKNNVMPELSNDDFLEPNDQDHFNRLKLSRKILDQAQASYDQVLEELKGKYTHPKVSCAGVEFLQVERQGPVSYSKIPELKNLDPEYLEKFRGSPTKYIKVSFKESI